MQAEGEGHRDLDVEETHHFYKINQKDLPRSDKYQLISTKANPSVLIVWLETYLKEQFKNKNIFIK